MTGVVLPIITLINKTDMSFDEEMLDVSPFSEHARSRMHKVLIHEEKALQYIITMSTARKTMCEGIIKMLTPHFVRAFSYRHIISCDENVTTSICNTLNYEMQNNTKIKQIHT